MQNQVDLTNRPYFDSILADYFDDPSVLLFRRFLKINIVYQDLCKAAKPL